MGSIVSKIEGPVKAAMPAFVGLSPKMGHMPWARTGEPGYLGVSHAPFQPNREGGTADMSLKGITLDRLHDRHGLLQGMDDARGESLRIGAQAGEQIQRIAQFGLGFARQHVAVRQQRVQAHAPGFVEMIADPAALEGLQEEGLLSDD